MWVTRARALRAGGPPGLGRAAKLSFHFFKKIQFAYYFM
jgi:hypothetical protein